MQPAEALQKLQEGNKRFIGGMRSIHPPTLPLRRQELAQNGQSPFAVVLTCSDSRVPAEILFDCTLGDLFVVRVAGNIVAPSLIGSVEFAALTLGTPLCLVMGHTECGAVRAAVEALHKGVEPPSDNIDRIIHEIAPSVAEVGKSGPHSQSEVERLIVAQNVRHSAARLLGKSSIIKDLIAKEKFRIVGGVYDIHSGKVDFDIG